MAQELDANGEFTQKKAVKHRKPESERTSTIAMTLPNPLIKQIDDYIDSINENCSPFEKKMTRSAFFRTVSIYYFDNVVFPKEITSAEHDEAAEDDIIERMQDAGKNYGLL